MKRSFLPICGADDLRSLPVRDGFASRHYIGLAEVSRLGERDKGHRRHVAEVDIGNLAVTRSRVDGAFVDDVLAPGQEGSA